MDDCRPLAFNFLIKRCWLRTTAFFFGASSTTFSTTPIATTALDSQSFYVSHGTIALYVRYAPTPPVQPRPNLSKFRVIQSQTIQNATSIIHLSENNIFTPIANQPHSTLHLFDLLAVNWKISPRQASHNLSSHMCIGRFICRHPQTFSFIYISFPFSYLWRILRQLSYLCPSTPSKNPLPLFIFFVFLFFLFHLAYIYTVVVSSVLISFSFYFFFLHWTPTYS